VLGLGQAAQLAHLAEEGDQPAPPRALSERLEGRQHGFRAGVVGVVHHAEALGRGALVEPLLDAYLLQLLGTQGQVDPGLAAGGQRRQRVSGLMPAGQRQPHPDALDGHLGAVLERPVALAPEIA